MWSQLLPGAPPDGWRRKPRPHVRVDVTHPLARGLTGCWLMSEDAGPTSYDNVSGNSFTTGSTYVRAAGPFGGWASQWLGGVSCANQNGFSNAQLTVLCWVNSLATQASRCF